MKNKISFEEFIGTLIVENGVFIKTDRDLRFWKEQYASYMDGCRDVSMHDNTLGAMSNIEMKEE